MSKQPIFKKATSKAPKAPDAGGQLSLNTATNVPATRPSKVADESPAALYAVGDSVQVNSNYENRNFRGQTGVIQTAVLKRGKKSGK